MELAGKAIYFVLWVAFVLLIARLVLDWVQMLARQWRPRGAIAVLCEGIYSVTDPPLRAVRGVIPPLRLGTIMLDLSPMILLFGIVILQRIVVAVFF
ncbi:MAG: YggT family protein [Aeromicrobium sp.]